MGFAILYMLVMEVETGLVWSPSTVNQGLYDVTRLISVSFHEPHTVSPIGIPHQFCVYGVLVIECTHVAVFAKRYYDRSIIPYMETSSPNLGKSPP